MVVEQLQRIEDRKVPQISMLTSGFGVNVGWGFCLSSVVIRFCFHGFLRALLLVKLASIWRKRPCHFKLSQQRHRSMVLFPFLG